MTAYRLKKLLRSPKLVYGVQATVSQEDRHGLDANALATILAGLRLLYCLAAQLCFDRSI